MNEVKFTATFWPSKRTTKRSLARMSSVLRLYAIGCDGLGPQDTGTEALQIY